ncbi:MAG: phage terminase large subunit [Candidatus Kapaibacteriota bacterium]
MQHSISNIGRLILKDKWREPDHLKLLEQLLYHLARREIYRLVVNMPPRYGKSLVTSLLFPFWYIGNYPDHNVMIVTYQNKLAQMWGKRIRHLIMDFGKELFNLSLQRAERSSSSMAIEGYAGRIICVGAGGLLTGVGADAIVVDDPIKNQKEALSLHQRNTLWEWFKATLFTRLEPNGILLIVATRWHEDDIFGRLMSSNETCEITKDFFDYFERNKKSNIWYVLKLPAIAKENDALGRNPGEPLWKERFSIDALLEQKKTLGDFWFSALYQQEPIFSTGKIFKRENFRYFTLLNDKILVQTLGNKSVQYDYVLVKNCSIFVTMDLAIKTSERSDYTVALVFAVDQKKDVYILEVLRQKFDASDHLKIIQNIFTRWQPVLIGIESIQYQFTLIQNARRLGIPVKELHPDKDKIARSLAIANWIDSGKVFFRRDTSWLEEFERELVSFPDGNHDDQVDALAYIMQLIEPIGIARVSGINKNKSKELLSLFY